MISPSLFLEEFVYLLINSYIDYFSYLLSVRSDPIFILLFLQHIFCI